MYVRNGHLFLVVEWMVFIVHFFILARQEIDLSASSVTHLGSESAPFLFPHARALHGTVTLHSACRDGDRSVCTISVLYVGACPAQIPFQKCSGTIIINSTCAAKMDTCALRALETDLQNAFNFREWKSNTRAQTNVKLCIYIYCFIISIYLWLLLFYYRNVNLTVYFVSLYCNTVTNLPHL